jgi:hypothetical protein
MQAHAYMLSEERLQRPPYDQFEGKSFEELRQFVVERVPDDQAQVVSAALDLLGVHEVKAYETSQRGWEKVIEADEDYWDSERLRAERVEQSVEENNRLDRRE